MRITKRTQLPELINKLNLKTGVEVGVETGRFSEHLLKNSNLEVLYSIDAWSTDFETTKSFRTKRWKDEVDELYKEAITRLQPFNSRSVIVKDISSNAVKQFKDGSLDFIYLDASHLFSGFAFDLINWWPKLKEGGLFAGHDCIRKHLYHVCYCINAFCLEHKQFYYLTTDDDGHPGNTKGNTYTSWYLFKKLRKKKEWRKEFENYKVEMVEQQKKLNGKVDIMYECFDK